MIKATVLRPVWTTKRIDGFPTGALLEVQRHESDQRYVALDYLGSGPGDEVLVAMGSAVANHLPGNTPTDALVIGIIDQPTFRITQPNEKGTSHE